MLYISIGILFILLAIFVGIKGNNCRKNSEENILEDIPAINISKEELKKTCLRNSQLFN